jgi:hypothetical protein
MPPASFDGFRADGFLRTQSYMPMRRRAPALFRALVFTAPPRRSLLLHRLPDVRRRESGNLRSHIGRPATAGEHSGGDALRIAAQVREQRSIYALVLRDVRSPPREPALLFVCIFASSRLRQAISNSDTPTHWSFAAGAIPTYVHAPSGERVRTSVLAQHMFVKPEDGVGVAHALDDGAPRFLDDGDTTVPSDLLTPTPAPNNGTPVPPSDPSTLLPLRCHCGTFRAALRRPSMLQMSSDMLRDSWNDHWAWSLCACNDCRRSSGFPLSSFIFVSAAAVVSSNGEPTDPFSLSGLVVHASSPNTRRAFCGTCGASVFYQYSRTGSASEPIKLADTLDVHLGVLDCPDGLGAAYLEWLWRRVGTENTRNMEDRELADALRRGMNRLQAANA